MTRFTNGRRTVHVGYSTNVHRSESVADVEAFLRDVTGPVREALGLSRLGIDLRLGDRLARELLPSGKAEALRDRLDATGIYVFGINAFPLGDFQARRVKTDVYLPAWDDPARLRATVDIARVSSRLAPEGTRIPVSTLAGGYRAFGDDDDTQCRMAEHFLDAAIAFARLSEETGRFLTLTPEPEPDTTLDDVASTVRFYETRLCPAAERRGASAIAALATHLPLNLDACHLSVAFESPSTTIATLARSGIAIGKCNVSSCLALPDPAQNTPGRALLAGMHEPRFLHQTWGRDSSGCVALRLPDLDAFARLDATDLASIDEVRSHFHVPLHHASIGDGLSTTQSDTIDFLRAILETDCEALAIETYTWHALEELDRSRQDLTSGLADELRWTFEQLEAAGYVRIDDPTA